MPGGCRTGDLARIVGFDKPAEKVDLQKIVRVGKPRWWLHDSRRHFECTSLSGPLVATLYCGHTHRSLGDVVRSDTLDIPDVHLEPIRDLPTLFHEATYEEVIEL